MPGSAIQITLVDSPFSGAWLAGRGFSVVPDKADGPKIIFRILSDDDLTEDLQALPPGQAIACGDVLYCRDGYVEPGETIVAWTASSSPCSATFELAAAIAFARQGAAVLHCCAFAINGRGVLAVGPSGVGKSTLALAAIQAGGRVVSDDLALVFMHENKPNARWLRSDLSFRLDTIEKTNALGLKHSPGRSLNGEQRRNVCRAHHPEVFRDNLNIDQIWLLDPPIHKGVTRVLSQGEAYCRLTQQTSAMFLARPHLGAKALQQCLLALLDTTLVRHVRLPLTLLHAPETVFRDLL